MDDPNKPKKYSVWLLITMFCFVMTAAAAFIPAATGQPQTPQTGSSLVLWGGLSMWLVWRHNGRTPWVGVVVGIVTGLLVFGVASFVGGFLRHAA
jgi:hypothetical protein